mmetsp:Transcript_9211/g.27739  ORF Transcript_9211/g.27739 Transcript_9211/m.27739 type:complete len:101 (+) Transcript_9211:85-387(+)
MNHSACKRSLSASQYLNHYDLVHKCKSKQKSLPCAWADNTLAVRALPMHQYSESIEWETNFNIVAATNMPSFFSTSYTRIVGVNVFHDVQSSTSVTPLDQ